MGCSRTVLHGTVGQDGHLGYSSRVWYTWDVLGLSYLSYLGPWDRTDTWDLAAECGTHGTFQDCPTCPTLDCGIGQTPGIQLQGVVHMGRSRTVLPVLHGTIGQDGHLRSSSRVWYTQDVLVLSYLSYMGLWDTTDTWDLAVECDTHGTFQDCPTCPTWDYRIGRTPGIQQQSVVHTRRPSTVLPVLHGTTVGQDGHLGSSSRVWYAWDVLGLSYMGLWDRTDTWDLAVECSTQGMSQDCPTCRTRDCGIGRTPGIQQQRLVHTGRPRTVLPILHRTVGQDGHLGQSVVHMGCSRTVLPFLPGTVGQEGHLGSSSRVWYTRDVLRLSYLSYMGLWDRKDTYMCRYIQNSQDNGTIVLCNPKDIPTRDSPTQDSGL